MLLIFSTTLYADTASNTQFIIQAPDGRYYMDESTVIALANYIKQLEELNKNYGLQIDNLSKQVELLKQQNITLQAQVDSLNQQLKEEKNKQLIYTVVAVITIGTTIILFLK